MQNFQAAARSSSAVASGSQGSHRHHILDQNHPLSQQQQPHQLIKVANNNNNNDNKNSIGSQSISIHDGPASAGGACTNMKSKSDRYVLQVFVGDFSSFFEALLIEASKQTTAEEIIECIVDKLRLKQSNCYELAEVMGQWNDSSPTDQLSCSTVPLSSPSSTSSNNVASNTNTALLDSSMTPANAITLTTNQSETSFSTTNTSMSSTSSYHLIPSSMSTSLSNIDPDLDSSNITLSTSTSSTAANNDWRERRILPNECPVSLQKKWRKKNSDIQYRFYLRSKLMQSMHWSFSWTDTDDSQMIRDYITRFLYQPKDRQYPDLCQLPDLTEQTLLENLKARFEKGRIYTYVGSILIAVNPFTYFPIYQPGMVQLYQSRRLGEFPPHIFAIADASYQTMLKRRTNQVIVISGESGSGKTVNTNLLLHHLTALSQKGTSGSGVEQTLLSAGPFLEAFGNAKTKHNNNSSRFGKFIQVNYRESGMVSGAIVQKYLLEKSRIVSLAKDERNYHVFYYLLAGASQADKEEFNLKSPNDYNYLNQSSCFQLDNSDEVYEFDRLKKSMENVGLKPDKQHRLFSVLSAILHLGNIEFIKKTTYHSDETVQVSDPQVVSIISRLLGIKKETLLSSLSCKRTKAAKGETIVINYRLPEAIATRDAMAKCLYAALFDWIVTRVNQALLSKRENRDFKGNYIGVLDIFGFEDFGDQNYFEQFCINFANEHLHSYFNQHVFKYEQEEYRREGICWKEIDFVDNSDCLKLIEGRPHGLLCLLDDQCNFPGATNQTTLTKFIQHHRDNSLFKIPPSRQRAFIIKHYAGQVKYQITDFREKNSDLMRPDIVGVLKSSSLTFVRELVGTCPLAQFRWQILRAFLRAYFIFSKLREASRAARASNSKNGMPSADIDTVVSGQTGLNTSSIFNKSSATHRYSLNKVPSFKGKVLKSVKLLQTLKQLTSKPHTVSQAFARTGTSKRTPTVTAQFQVSLNQLMETLNQANPYFVRCIKSNADKKPNCFDDVLVLLQLRYTGMLETVRIRQSGYSVRLLYTEFSQHYRILLANGLKSSRQDIGEFLVKMKLDPGNYQMGKTKVFMRETEKLYLDERLHQEILSSIITLQRSVRSWIARRNFLKMRWAAIVIQSHVRRRLAQREKTRLKSLLMQDAHNAATVIQKHWRRRRAQRQYQLTRARIIQLQSLVRGHLIRSRIAQRAPKLRPSASNSTSVASPDDLYRQGANGIHDPSIRSTAHQRLSKSSSTLSSHHDRSSMSPSTDVLGRLSSHDSKSVSHRLSSSRTGLSLCSDLSSPNGLTSTTASSMDSAFVTPPSTSCKLTKNSSPIVSDSRISQTRKSPPSALSWQNSGALPAPPPRTKTRSRPPFVASASVGDPTTVSSKPCSSVSSTNHSAQALPITMSRVPVGHNFSQSVSMPINAGPNQIGSKHSASRGSSVLYDPSAAGVRSSPSMSTSASTSSFYNSTNKSPVKPPAAVSKAPATSTSYWNVTRTCQFTDPKDILLTDVQELQNMGIFISKKIYQMDEQKRISSKESTVDIVFKQALREFRTNLLSTYSVAAQDGHLCISYRNLIDHFAQVIFNVCQKKNTWKSFPVIMGVNAFRGFMDEFRSLSAKKAKFSERLTRGSENWRRDGPKFRRRLNHRQMKEVVEKQGHKMFMTIANIPTVCEVCSALVKLSGKILVCNDCKLTCHKKCLPKVIVSCRDNSLIQQGKKVFGSSLERLVKEDERVPAVLEQLMSAIEMKGLYVEGLYRKSATTSKINELKQRLEEDRANVDLDSYGIHVLTAVLKSFFREMPEPLMTFQLYDDFLWSTAITDLQERYQVIYSHINKLSRVNYDVLERLIFHLARVALNEHANRMSASSLAIVFAPCVLRTDKPMQAQDSFDDIRKQTICLECLISERMKEVRKTLVEIEALDSATHSAESQLNNIRRSKVNVRAISKQPDSQMNSTALEEEARLTLQIQNLQSEKSHLTNMLPSFRMASAGSEDDLVDASQGENIDHSLDLDCDNNNRPTAVVNENIRPVGGTAATVCLMTVKM
ncbi:Unconventional myosin-IXb [Fragariocoptes setiger]|uniref:Unconventional myosin-IXb n=1 Tax=Fragariocoptes setiger TaxID=1670756 RepID=A0ABQ7S6T5_9ACAR|nr:Unconventional myosin-IXb [Fragariocoptes setiger]